jgi:aryl carrier-like protein
MENILSSLWSVALELEEKISRDDHFFRLGGDSIKAMKLSASARRAGMKLSVQSIFKYPCLERMAKEVDTLVDDETRDKEG